jgi:peptidoglycan hydrolase-like protein with peptidoglycan-binding domain
MKAIDKLISIARAEVGYIEKKSKSQLDDKTANIGSKNYTKYARDLDAISGFYNTRKQGHAWCDVFTDWCFVQAFGVENARKLLCQTGGRKLGAGCKYSMGYYKNDGKFYTEPQIGDQIFFYTADKKGIAHTGIVVGLENGRVQTIEGNTRPDSEVVNNGGMVCEKDYSKTYARIAGYGRPDYSIIPTEPEVYVPTVLVWQTAAMADGFVPPKYFSRYGADGEWGKECEAVAKKAVIKKQIIGYKYPELTKIVQKIVGFTGDDVDGKCGKDTREAIKVYQKAHGLKVDGQVGLNTWKVMLEV